MGEIIDGRLLRNKILEQLKTKIAEQNLKLKLAIVLVGDNEASLRYIKQKQKMATEIGADSVLVNLPDNVTQKELEEKISQLNQDKSITGLIIQLPLPKTLEATSILQKIDSRKDVDGLTENSPFQPATPLGIMKILHEHKVQISGKTAVVLGRSKLVGLPVKEMLEKEGAKVIQIHSQTPKPIDSLVQQGDIVISAVGRGQKLVTAEMVKDGAVVIDVGINTDSENNLVGDVDFEEVSKKASLITPVPGGVGPMTVAMLLSNLVRAEIKANK